MKVRIESSPTFTSSSMSESGFNIKASAKAFKILSSNLYANKIRAIVRELSTNAFDAHVAAGCTDTPFEVHLPSTIDPVFWIRDFGIGLSKDEVLNLYTTYFESTKSESNDYVGALGLGSKSPFSYSDSFTVASVHGGVRTAYSMSLKDGVPTVTVMGEVKTDDANGLMISIAVTSQQDINRFISEARYVYKTFNVKPIIHGREIDTDMIGVKQHDGYFMAGDSEFSTGLYALMGQIPYPVNTSQIKIPTALSSVINTTALFVEFGLGELDITPSREELSYDDETIKALNARIKVINDIIVEDLTSPYKDITSPRKAWNLIDGSNEIQYSMKNLLKNVLEIDGKSLNAWMRSYQWDNRSPKNNTSIGYQKFVIKNGDVTFTKCGKSYYNRDNLAAIQFRTIRLIDNDDGKTPRNTVRALIHSGDLDRNCTGYIFDTKDSEGRAIYDNLKTFYAADEIIEFVNSDCDVERKAYNKHAASIKNSTGATRTHKANVTVIRRRVDHRGVEIITSTASMYAEDIREYKGYYACQYFDDFVRGGIDELRETPAFSKSVVMNFMQAAGIDEIIVIRNGHFKAAHQGKAINVNDAIVKFMENASGRQIALKSREFAVGEPSYAKYIGEIDAKLYNKFTAPRRYSNLHNAAAMFNSIVSQFRTSPSVIDPYLTKAAKKQLNRFIGVKRAIATARSNALGSIEKKYPMIDRVCRSYVYGVESLMPFMPEIRKIVCGK